jgi:anti-anti-sigma regulatory factor
MAGEVTLGPINMTWTGSEVVLRFVDPGAMMAEIPAHLERDLSRLAQAHASELADKPWCIDLENVPTISSRQLGILLTVRKVGETAGPITLRGLAEPVATLLEVTRMIKLFNVEADEG